jgi:hypothetical protein
MDIPRRILKPLSSNHQTQIKSGQLVKLTRAEFTNMIPVGTLGEILSLEDPDSYIAKTARNMWDRTTPPYRHLPVHIPDANAYIRKLRA